MTLSTDIPYAGQPYDSTHGGDFDSFIAQFDFSASDIEDSPPVPRITALLPNYPNPFNASTSIRYSLSNPSDVTIEIYDILGRRIAVLAQGMQKAGNHSVVWDGGGFSSGTYFYRIQAGKFVGTRKMVLVK